MGMVAPTLYTAAMVRALPDDGQRHEAVNGELIVTPSPSLLHQRAVGRLFLVLAHGLEAGGSYETIVSPADVELDSHTLVQPDLCVTRTSGGRPTAWADVDLVLAAEVLSPSTARYDRLVKRQRYQAQGIEYWIVDLDARVLERWRPGEDRPEILAGHLEWQPPEAAATLAIDLEKFFAEVLDLPRTFPLRSRI
jgi:Uma2 family endonuclease